MGIINPRPTMRKAEARGVQSALVRHAELMAQYEAEGASREEASKKAFADLKAGKKS